jgi:transcriptional regulator with XRE-family HTH domain
MNAGAMLREARRSARLTQRALALEARMPQPTVARIESGAVVPRVDTLERLLAACGRTLSTQARPGAGVDRTQIAALLARSPRERLDVLTVEARNLDRLLTLAGRR